MRTTQRSDLELKLWSKVIKADGDACWEWQGATHDFGYGLVRFWLNGKQERYAHRLSWYLHTGDLGSAHILHRCDNPRCCRPSHLFPGTHLENVEDMRSKGRHGFGERHPMSKLTTDAIINCRARFANGEPLNALARELDVTASVLHRAIYGKGWKSAGQPLQQTAFGKLKPGEDHPKAKMTEADVVAARARRAAGAGVTDLAKKYGIGKSTMSKILLGRYWKHVT